MMAASCVVRARVGSQTERKDGCAVVSVGDVFVPSSVCMCFGFQCACRWERYRLIIVFLGLDNLTAAVWYITLNMSLLLQLCGACVLAG